MAEKFRMAYEQSAKENQIKSGKEYGIGKEQFTPNLVETVDKPKRQDNEVNTKLAKISGHQRVKACKELEIDLVPVMIREDLIDENEKLKILLSANFGRSKNNESKQRKVVSEYVELCGKKQGRQSKESNMDCLSLEEIASQLGTSVTNLKRSLRIERNLTDSVKELLDTGVITKTLASDTIASLSPEEQEDLIASLDVSKKITKKEVDKYIKENRELQEKVKNEKEKIFIRSSNRRRNS